MSRALKIVIAGHVDHGKSTLIGRLLHDTGSLPAGKADELEALSRKRGVALEWSFVLDALQTERDQAITIDTTRVWFTWNGRRYAIIDAPGHREFVRNMLSGASEADAAVLVVDVVEGVSEQTKRHAQLLQTLGIRQLTVVLNKMDANGYDAARFDEVARDTNSTLAALDLHPHSFIPISARNGENLRNRSENMAWYDGPTLLEALADFNPVNAIVDAPLRMRVQDVYRSDGIRIAAGRVESGSIAVGDTVLLSPMNSAATVRSIERWNAPDRSIATAGESIGITFNEPVFVNRGDVVSHVHQPPLLDYTFRAICFWLDESPPQIGEQVTAQFGPTTSRAVIAAVDGVMDSATLQQLASEHIPRYAVVQLRLRSSALLPLDEHNAMPASSRLVVLRGRDVVAGGIVSSVMTGNMPANLYHADHLVTPAERERRSGHRGAVIWLTGLSGAGKSTLAMALERALFTQSASVYVLDGDNVRAGLNSDLGFSAADRAENIRRVGEVAALFADAGTIVITAFISPMQRDREIARKAAGDRFHEIYLRADLPTCEARDTKGLYKRARAGEIADFTGISAPYEAPDSPELTIDTALLSVDRCVAELLSYVVPATGLRQEARAQRLE
jgi:bifunctional enzyme CysN/CysC